MKETKETKELKIGDRVGHKSYPKWSGTIKRIGHRTVYVLWDGYEDVMNHALEYITAAPAPVIADEVAKTIAQLEERRAKKIESRKADSAQIENYRVLIKNLQDRIDRTIVEQVSIIEQIELLKTKNEQ